MKKGLLYLCWQSLRHSPWKTLLLILAVALTVFLPLASRILVKESSGALQARAVSTPLLIGPKGSAIDLTLNSLYFLPQKLPILPYLSYQEAAALEKGNIIPLHVRFHAGDARVVGTTSEYFSKRGIALHTGEVFQRMGDCVLGAKLAKTRQLSVGDSIITSPENVFDLAGAYPVKLKITGILAESHSPDDSTVFTQLETAWLLEGLAHGHATENTSGDEPVEYTEVTDDTIDSFHFHGSKSQYPLTALIAYPDSDKDRALLLGYYQNDEIEDQIVIPAESLSQLSSTLFATEHLVFFGLLSLSLFCLVLILLVFALSLRLRSREMLTYQKIGASPGICLILKLSDIIAVFLAGCLLAAIALFITQSLITRIVPGLIA